MVTLSFIVLTALLLVFALGRQGGAWPAGANRGKSAQTSLTPSASAAWVTTLVAVPPGLGPWPDAGVPAPNWIGCYRLGRSLGHGTSGTVYEAIAPGGTPVAVKHVIRSAGEGEFQRETRALGLINRLRHPFLVSLHGGWAAPGQLFLVMELAERNLLEHFDGYRRTGLESPALELIGFMREIAEALDHCHSRGVLHRDVKPTNMLFLRGHAKLSDLGMARPLLDASVSASCCAGTPLYVAPEAWRRQPCPASDQYSLAASFVMLLLGRAPFAGSTLPDLIDDHLFNDPDLRGLNSAQRAVLRRALAKAPADRYASCGQFVEALAATVESLGAED